MHQTVTIQDLVIVVPTKRQKSIVLNSDFLRYSAIVPSDWELARSPIYTDQAAQVLFQNGIGLAAQPDRIIFSEMIEGKTLEEIQVSAVAQRYLKTLPNIDYQAVGISLRGYVAYTDEVDAEQQHLLTTILAPGSWQDFGKAPIKAGVSIVYTLERSRLSLTINEATLQAPERPSCPGVIFSGNFGYDLAEKTESERLEALTQTIADWRTDLEIFKDLINNRFLAKAVDQTAVPDLFAMSAPALR